MKSKLVELKEEIVVNLEGYEIRMKPSILYPGNVFIVLPNHEDPFHVHPNDEFEVMELLKEIEQVRPLTPVSACDLLDLMEVAAAPE